MGLIIYDSDGRIVDGSSTGDGADAGRSRPINREAVVRMRALKTFTNNQTGMIYPGQIYEVTLLVAQAHERSGIGERCETTDVATYETASVDVPEVQAAPVAAKRPARRRKTATKKGPED